MINDSPVNSTAINADAETITGPAPPWVVPDYSNWDIQVVLDGVDVSASLFGIIKIDIERSAARLAEFKMLISGSVTGDTWTGKTVVIYYSNESTTYQKFTGVVIEPIIDIGNKSVTCRCSDDFQRKIDALSNAAIKTALGGYWSKFVFSETNTGWRYAQDLLTTVNKSMQLNDAGSVEVTGKTASATADYTFDSGIIDESLSVTLVKRSDIINKVQIKFDVRFERLFHRLQRFEWTTGPTFCAWSADTYRLPNQGMIESACNSNSWRLTSKSFTSLWPSGLYTCSGNPVAHINDYPDGIIGFDVSAAFRWQQSVTDSFDITVTAADSVTAFGELKNTLQFSADFPSTITGWTDQASDYTYLPTGFSLDSEKDQYRDELNIVEMNAALDCAIAVAIQKINESHASSSVAFKTPLFPTAAIDKTVAIADADCAATGVLSRIEHEFDFDKGTAITQMTVQVSAGKSTSANPTQTWTLPAHVGLPPGTIGWHAIDSMDVHIGGKTASPAEDSAWTGLLTNYDLQDAGAHVYSSEIRLKFRAIDDAKTQNKTQTITHSIALSVPNNSLVLY